VETITAPRILQSKSYHTKNMTTQILSGGGNADNTDDEDVHQVIVESKKRLMSA
jgi:hypothetical protein